MSKWHGELRLHAIDKDRIVFLTDPNDEFKLTPGRRYACALVEIDDQEKLAPQAQERAGVHRAQRNPSNQAAILAKRADFQRFAVAQLRSSSGEALPENEQTATEYIRRTCGVSSRAELDTDVNALEAFHNIELAFYREIGERIA